MYFLSFSSKDKQIADQIHHHLSRSDLKIWYSPKSVITGANYALEIAKAIKCSSGVILVYSSNAISSSHILRELEIAIANEKAIYPLRISGDEPIGAMEYYLSGVQWRDLFDGYEAHLHAFSDFLKAIERNRHNKDRHLKDTHNLTTTYNSARTDSEWSLVQSAERTEVVQFLKEAIAIDMQSYEEDFIGILSQCLDWYKANPEIYTFALDSRRRVTGYINAMPIEEKTYHLILDGNFVDNEIPPEAIIQPTFPGEFYVYFCSIGVDERCRNGRIFRHLFDGFVEKMHYWYNEGYIVKGIISDAVTRNGVKMCELTGCTREKRTNHGSSLYTLSMLPPQIKPTTSMVRSLIEKYRDYFNASIGMNSGHR